MTQNTGYRHTGYRIYIINNTEHEKKTECRRTGYRIYIIKNRGHDTEHMIQLKRRYEKDGVQKDV